jgi:hypothetical protein
MDLTAQKLKTSQTLLELMVTRFWKILESTRQELENLMKKLPIPIW